MKCPNCNANLIMSERSGIEIDYCPECRGVWLDRGELDKIIERSSQSVQNTQAINQGNNQNYYKGSSSNYNNKKKGLLSDLFDF